MTNDPMVALAAEKHLAITSFVGGSAIPLFSAKRDQQSLIGTGTLFLIRDRLLLILAAHVLDALADGSLALPMDRSLRTLIGLGNYEAVRARLDKHDVALVSVTDAAVRARLEAAWTPLTLDCVGVPWSAKHPFMIFGYPESRRAQQRARRLLGLICDQYSGSTDDLGEPYDPQLDMLLDYPTQPLGGPAKGFEVPRLQGMSGASVWIVEPDSSPGLWTPASQVKLVGIQSSAKHGSYVRAKRWHLLWSLFENVDPDIARDVRAAIEAAVARRARAFQPKSRGTRAKRTSSRQNLRSVKKAAKGKRETSSRSPARSSDRKAPRSRKRIGKRAKKK